MFNVSRLVAMVLSHAVIASMSCSASDIYFDRLSSSVSAFIEGYSEVYGYGEPGGYDYQEQSTSYTFSDTVAVTTNLNASAGDTYLLHTPSSSAALNPAGQAVSNLAGSVMYNVASDHGFDGGYVFSETDANHTGYVEHVVQTVPPNSGYQTTASGAVNLAWLDTYLEVGYVTGTAGLVDFASWTIVLCEDAVSIDLDGGDLYVDGVWYPVTNSANVIMQTDCSDGDLASFSGGTAAYFGFEADGANGNLLSSGSIATNTVQITMAAPHDGGSGIYSLTVNGFLVASGIPGDSGGGGEGGGE